MKEKFSAHSMLKTTLTADERPIVSIIDDVGRNLRAMCRAMQIYGEHTGIWLKNSKDDLAEMKAVFEMFYEFVDYQVDGLSRTSSRGFRSKHYVKVKFSKRSVPRCPQKLSFRRERTFLIARIER